jgi:hypothetical protein
LTLDANGNYTREMVWWQDAPPGSWGWGRDNIYESSSSSAGKWYADPQEGLIDLVRTLGSPPNDYALSITKGYYEIDGDTLSLWENPVNMARADTPEESSTHTVLTRTQSKESDEQPGLAEWLRQVKFQIHAAGAHPKRAIWRPRTSSDQGTHGTREGSA